MERWKGSVLRAGLAAGGSQVWAGGRFCGSQGPVGCESGGKCGTAKVRKQKSKV